MRKSSNAWAMKQQSHRLMERRRRLMRRGVALGVAVASVGAASVALWAGARSAHHPLAAAHQESTASLPSGAPLPAMPGQSVTATTVLPRSFDLKNGGISVFGDDSNSFSVSGRPIVAQTP